MLLRAKALLLSKPGVIELAPDDGVLFKINEVLIHITSDRSPFFIELANENKKWVRFDGFKMTRFISLRFFYALFEGYDYKIFLGDQQIQTFLPSLSVEVDYLLNKWDRIINLLNNENFESTYEMREALNDDIKAHLHKNKDV